MSLQEAILAAEQRKQSVFGLEIGTHVSDEDQTRAIFSGFDLNFDEMNEAATQAGFLFYHQSQLLPIPAVCSGAWTEGFLVGLLYARFLPTTSVAGGKDASGPEGET